MNFAQKSKNLLITKITCQQPRGIKLAKCSFFSHSRGRKWIEWIVKWSRTDLCMYIYNHVFVIDQV